MARRRGVGGNLGHDGPRRAIRALGPRRATPGHSGIRAFGPRIHGQRGGSGGFVGGRAALRRGGGAGAARWWRGSSTQAGQAALRRGVGGAAARCWRGSSTQAGAVAATPCLRLSSASVLLRRCARSMRLCAMLLCWRQPRLALQCCVCVQSRPLGHSGHIGPHQATSGRSGIWAPRHRGTLAP